ncbi:MAG: ATP-binding protein [Pelistega sp.]|nr:ATP-binding protein [Pelistega sp.]
MSNPDLSLLITRALGVLEQLEAWLPAAPKPVDWSAKAFRWRKKGATAWLEAIHITDNIEPEDLLHIERQKEIIDRNTRFFMSGKPANNVLMTGSRGTGKSSLVKAMLNKYADQGLRLIEVDKTDLNDLGDIVDLVNQRPERFLIFCDDLSFDEGEVGYKALKSVLDGSIAASGENILIYATSNRRHLMPEYMQENLKTTYRDDGEVHPGEAIEEKISLSERFGLWLSFYPFRQDDYLAIVYYWLRQLGCPEEHIEASRTEALQWTIERGSRSGRVARHFARDWTARHLDK